MARIDKTPSKYTTEPSISFKIVVQRKVLSPILDSFEMQFSTSLSQSAGMLLNFEISCKMFALSWILDSLISYLSLTPQRRSNIF